MTMILQLCIVSDRDKVPSVTFIERFCYLATVGLTIKQCCLLLVIVKSVMSMFILINCVFEHQVLYNGSRNL